MSSGGGGSGGGIAPTKTRMGFIVKVYFVISLCALIRTMVSYVMRQLDTSTLRGLDPSHTISSATVEQMVTTNTTPSTISDTSRAACPGKNDTRNSLGNETEASAAAAVSSARPVIPQRLVFNYKTNILQDMQPSYLYKNINNTITLYLREWSSSCPATRTGVIPRERPPPPSLRLGRSHENPTTAGDAYDSDHSGTGQRILDERHHQQTEAGASSFASSSASNSSNPCEVVFYTDNGCREVIELAEPQLVRHFDNETFGPHKSDICRIADLYLYGGYYHDNEMVVLVPAIMPDRIQFTTVLERNDQNFFQSFLASVPGHPVLKEALHVMLDLYEKRRDGKLDDDRHQSGMGTKTLKDAYNAQVLERPEIAETSRLFREVDLGTERYLYRDTNRVPKRTLAVHWPEGHKVYFLSRP